jgi:erythromycin esterase-like protein
MHGAHEPLAFRNRLSFLVERMGFTAIELESGFTESISARSFIERGEGDAETATRTGLGSWLIQLIRLSTAVVAFVFVNTLTPAVSN